MNGKKKVQILIWHWIKVLFPVTGNSFVVELFQHGDVFYRGRRFSVSGCRSRKIAISVEDSRLQTDGIMVQMAFNSRRRKDRYEELFARDAYCRDKGRPLPKFGEWDVNDPASAEGFTVIFNKARDEKKTGGGGGKPESPGKSDSVLKHGVNSAKPQSKKWFCCVQPSHAET